jgi:hypothetical protein
MPKTIKLSFDGEVLDCLVTTAQNGETICYAKDRRFIKFPPGTDLAKAAKKHNAAHKKKPVFSEEVEAQQAELDSWFNEEIALGEKTDDE